MKKYLYLLIAIFITMVSLIYFNKQYLQKYFFNLENNHFKIGDKIHMDKEMIKISQSSISLYRLIKITSTNELRLQEINWEISADSLRKYKTDIVGKYIGYTIKRIKVGDKYFYLDAYAIDPNSKALHMTTYKSDPSDALPNTYINVNTLFYMSAGLARDH